MPSDIVHVPHLNVMILACVRSSAGIFVRCNIVFTFSLYFSVDMIYNKVVTKML